jgi:hypothetical protein
VFRHVHCSMQWRIRRPKSGLNTAWRFPDSPKDICCPAPYQMLTVQVLQDKKDRRAMMHVPPRLKKCFVLLFQSFFFQQFFLKKTFNHSTTSTLHAKKKNNLTCYHRTTVAKCCRWCKIRSWLTVVTTIHGGLLLLASSLVHIWISSCTSIAN